MHVNNVSLTVCLIVKNIRGQSQESNLDRYLFGILSTCIAFFPFLLPLRPTAFGCTCCGSSSFFSSSTPATPAGSAAASAAAPTPSLLLSFRGLCFFTVINCFAVGSHDLHSESDGFWLFVRQNSSNSGPNFSTKQAIRKFS